MSCIHVDTSGQLPLPATIWQLDEQRPPERYTDDHGHPHVMTWFRCGHCGAPGFKRDSSGVVYTWEPRHTIER